MNIDDVGKEVNFTGSLYSYVDDRSILTMCIVDTVSGRTLYLADKPKAIGRQTKAIREWMKDVLRT